MFQRLLAPFLLLLPAVSGTNYDGMFKILSAQDSEQGVVPIPGDFNVVIRSEGDSRYAMSARIGNSLRGEMVVTEGADGAHDSVHVGDIMSTSKCSSSTIDSCSEGAWGVLLWHTKNAPEC